MVDSVSLIVGALAAGALAGTKDVAAVAVRDAYDGLKDMIVRRMRDDPAGQVALQGYQTEPQVWQAHLVQALQAAGAGDDTSMLEAAARLLALVDPAGAAAGKYALDARHAKGMQVGDQNTQYNYF